MPLAEPLDIRRKGRIAKCWASMIISIHEDLQTHEDLQMHNILRTTSSNTPNMRPSRQLVGHSPEQLLTRGFAGRQHCQSLFQLFFSEQVHSLGLYQRGEDLR